MTDMEKVPTAEFLHSIHKVLNIASRRGPTNANCLPRSLVLCRVLRKYGFRSQVKVGIHNQVSNFRAHAWVEVDGRVVGENIAEFREFDGLNEKQN